VIAEDETLIRMDLAEMLGEEGYDVVGQAGNGARAVELAEELRPDLVIVDPAFDIFDDLVRNAPDLSNRPKIMDGGRLDAAQIRFLCGRYRVEIFDIDDGVRVGLPRIIPPGLAQRPPSAVRQACGAPPSQVRAP